MTGNSIPTPLTQAKQEYEKALKDVKRRVVHLASLPFFWQKPDDLHELHAIATGSDATEPLTPEEVRLLVKLYPILDSCAKCLALNTETSLHFCKSCGVVQYCGRRCQRECLKEHRKYCAMLNGLRRGGQLEFAAGDE